MKARLIVLCGIVLATSATVFAQSDFNTAPGYQTGERVLGSYFAVDIDSVSLTNGNLLLNIPLFALPGREVPLKLTMSYNSRFFEQRKFLDEFGQPYTDWEFMGWRKDTGVSGLLTGVKTFVSNSGFIATFTLQVYWIEPNGTKHSFPSQSVQQTCTGDASWVNGVCTQYPGGVDPPLPMPSDDELWQNRTFDSTESDFIRIYTGNYFVGGSATVYLKDGSKTLPWGQTAVVRTLNGNEVTGNSATATRTYRNINLKDVLPTSDTVGRTITYSSVGNQETITLQDSNGQNKTYTINWTNISGRNPADTAPVSLRVIQSIGLPNGRTYTFQYNSQGYISKILLPSGAYFRYEYNHPSNSGFNVTRRAICLNPPDPNTNCTAANENAWTYAYTYNGDTVVSTTVTDPTGALVTHSYTNGLETQTDIKNIIGQVVQRIERTWTGASDQRVLTQKATLDSKFVRQTTFAYDSYNNLTLQEDFDVAVGAPGAKLRSISRAYLQTNPVNNINYTTYRILNRVASESISDGIGNVIAQTQFEYDNYASPNTLVTRTGSIPGWTDPGSTVRGNVTAVKRWLNPGNTWLSPTVNQYDVLGNTVKVTDPASHATNIDFTDKFTDSVNRYSYALPTRVTNPAGFYVDTTYDFKTGLAKQTTDSLNRTTTTTYDLMNRDTQTNYPNGGRTTYVYDDVTPKTTKEVLVDTLNNVGRVITTFDKLYRPIKKETADPAGNIFVETQYDSKGRKWKASNPYRTGDTVLWTQSQYDATDRPIVITAPDNSTVQYGYLGAKTTVTDEAGNSRRYTYDGLGRMTQVEEPNPTLATPLVTAYTYNVLGKLTQTTQGSQTRTFVLDSLGRMTSQALPESGTTSFTYDSEDQLLTKTDARGITVTMTYGTSGGSIHQGVSRTYSDSTPAVSFGYNTQGLRTSMADGIGTVTYSYNANTDKLTQESRTLTGVTGTFTTGYAYNIKGDLTQMTYPSGRVVNLNYATGGGCCNSRLASVVDQTTTTTIAGSLTYNAAGETTSLTLGNSVIDTFGYNTRLQQTAITAVLGATTLMNFAYDYGTSTTNTGRVLSRTDSIQPEHSTKYAYDSIYRLGQVVSNDAGSSWGIAWTFDIWGNRLTQIPQGLATTKVGTQTLGYTNNRLTTNTYDAAGNQTNDGLHNYTFNAENQITQMDGGAAVYGYDGEGRRTKKTANGETTYTFYGPGGVISEYTTSNVISAATVATSTDKCFYHMTDKLGSAVLVIAANGTVIENNRTLPYGEAWLTDTASTNDKKFTTYQRDPESGLDYAMNRYDSSSNGRFMSTDKGLPVLFAPQTLNRFVYVINDPINNSDPDGNQIPNDCRPTPGMWTTCYGAPVNPFSGFDMWLLSRFLTGLGGDAGMSWGWEDAILMEPEWLRNWRKPVAFDCIITGKFGEARRNGKIHWGTDVSTAERRGGQGFGTPIFSLTAGTITDVRISNDPAKQNWVTVQTSVGSYLTYMHITANVRVGDIVSMGHVLGVTDNSGSAGASATFGPHVHIFGTWNGIIDPDNTRNRFSVETAILNSGCAYRE